MATKKSGVWRRDGSVEVQPLRAAPTPSDSDADFLPPGMSSEAAPAPEGEVTTYFLQTEKRGISPYLEGALKHYQQGFRGVIVSNRPLVFDRPSARVVGKLKGDHFESALAWAKSDPLIELHAEHVRTGGGTPKDRERAAARYVSLLDEIEAVKATLAKLDAELDVASEELVRRFGRQPMVISGKTHDACHGPGGKVFWRRRG